MLSDVLLDAVAEVERCEEGFPRIYGPAGDYPPEVRAKLVQLKSDMRAVALELARPPRPEDLQLTRED